MNKHSFLAAAVTGILLGSSMTAFAGESAPGSEQSGKEKGKDKASQGEKHACKGQNACKGQGGCKTDKHACKAQNACKGQGGCKAA